MSRRNLLIAAAALVATVGVIVAVAAGGGDDSPSPSSAPKSTTTATERALAGDTATSRAADGSTTTGAGATTTTAAGSTTTGVGATSTTAKGSLPSVPPTATTAPPPTATELSLRTAYRNAWNGVCHEIWAHSPEGIIFDGTDIDWQLDISDCLSGLNDLVAPTEGSAAAAASEGRRDALDDLWTSTLSGTVCWLDANEEHWQGCYDTDADKVVAPPEP